MARILPSASRRTPNNANNHHPQSQKGALARTLERWRTLFSVKLQLLISGFELRSPGAFYSLGRAVAAFGESSRCQLRRRGSAAMTTDSSDTREFTIGVDIGGTKVRRTRQPARRIDEGSARSHESARLRGGRICRRYRRGGQGSSGPCRD